MRIGSRRKCVILEEEDVEECSYTLDSSKEVIVRERFTGGITVRGKAGEECNLLKSVFYSFPNTFLIDAVI